MEETVHYEEADLKSATESKASGKKAKLSEEPSFK
jgi:hypothetical protein